MANKILILIVDTKLMKIIIFRNVCKKKRMGHENLVKLLGEKSIWGHSVLQGISWRVIVMVHQR